MSNQAKAAIEQLYLAMCILQEWMSDSLPGGDDRVSVSRERLDKARDSIREMIKESPDAVHAVDDEIVERALHMSLQQRKVSDRILHATRSLEAGDFVITKGDTRVIHVRHVGSGGSFDGITSNGTWVSFGKGTDYDIVEKVIKPWTMAEAAMALGKNDMSVVCGGVHHRVRRIGEAYIDVLDGIGTTEIRYDTMASDDSWSCGGEPCGTVAWEPVD